MKLCNTASSTRASAPFNLLTVLLVTATVTFAACGDDGNVADPDGSAGKAGSSSAGSPHGDGEAGSQEYAGVSSGGATSDGGSVSSGGAISTSGATGNGGALNHAGTASGGGSACNIGECFRANVCLDECDGNVVYTGCCACPAGTVEQLSCASTGGQGSGGQTSSDCVGATCTTGQTCVAYRTVGGAVFPPDEQGMCMGGRHVEGQACQANFAYTCAELTGCGASAATCRCAANTACANTTVCKAPSASAWLDPSADLVCELLAP